jgi:hypothetical protein
VLRVVFILTGINISVRKTAQARLVDFQSEKYLMVDLTCIFRSHGQPVCRSCCTACTRCTAKYLLRIRL